ncbi:PadR family transcriptional regulator [candidate division KSB1 bacterium]
MKELSKAEEVFLIAIWRLKENAYGVSIRDKIAEMTGKMYTYGTLYGILDQLVHREYAVKIEGEPSPERGGRRKLFYRLTKEGSAALKNSFEVQRTLWKGIDRHALEKGFTL